MQPTVEIKFDFQFKSYICYGDFITTTVDGFDVTARIITDDSTPKEFDCYSAEQIQAWRNGEWWFCGIVLSVAKNDIVLDHYAASLWGIEANFPGGDNSYLTEVANDLLPEAISRGKEIIRLLCA